MGQPIVSSNQTTVQTLAAPNNAIGTSIVGPSGTRYTSNASGQAVVAAMDVQAMLGMGWTQIYGTTTLTAPGTRSGISITGPSGTTYTSGSQGTASFLSGDVAYALQNGWTSTGSSIYATDSSGNVTGLVGPNGPAPSQPMVTTISNLTYDSQGRLSSFTENGVISTLTYNANGTTATMVVTYTNAAIQTNVFSYDAYGNFTGSTVQ